MLGGSSNVSLAYISASFTTGTMDSERRLAQQVSLRTKSFASYNFARPFSATRQHKTAVSLIKAGFWPTLTTHCAQIYQQRSLPRLYDNPFNMLINGHTARSSRKHESFYLVVRPKSLKTAVCQVVKFKASFGLFSKPRVTSLVSDCAITKRGFHVCLLIARGILSERWMKHCFLPLMNANYFKCCVLFNANLNQVFAI